MLEESFLIERDMEKYVKRFSAAPKLCTLNDILISFQIGTLLKKHSQTNTSKEAMDLNFQQLPTLWQNIIFVELTLSKVIRL